MSISVEGRRVREVRGFRPTGRSNRFDPPRDHITEHEHEHEHEHELARPLGAGGFS